MWRYIGPRAGDAHRREYFPGMTLHAAGRTATLLDTLLGTDADPGVAELRRFYDHNGDKCSALIYRHDGAVCGFVCVDDIGGETPDTMVPRIRRLFPELFTGHRVPFAAIREAAPCEAQPSAPNLSEASASSTAKAAPGSKPGKPSRKSSA